MKVHFDCDDRISRPVLILDSIFEGCRALVDTGAVFPVWTAPESELTLLGAKPDPTTTSRTIRGFGGFAEGNLYRITIELGGILYVDLPILAVEFATNRFNMVLPSTMFSDMEMVIDFKNHRLDLDTLSNQVVYHLRYKEGDDGTLVLING